MKLCVNKAYTLLSVCGIHNTTVIQHNTTVDWEVLNCGPWDSLETKQQQKKKISNIQ